MSSTTVPSPELAPCPHCGFSGEFLRLEKFTTTVDGVEVSTYYIRCGCPDARVFSTEEAARTAWPSPPMRQLGVW